jgi:hypothetical protein
VNLTRLYMFLLHLVVVAGGVWLGLRLIEAIAGP